MRCKRFLSVLIIFGHTLSHAFEVPTVGDLGRHVQQLPDRAAQLLTLDSIPFWMQSILNVYWGYHFVQNLRGTELMPDSDVPGQKSQYRDIQRRLTQEVARNKVYLDRQNGMLYPAQQMQFDGPGVVTSLRMSLNPGGQQNQLITLDAPSLERATRPLTQDAIERFIAAAEAPDYQALVIEDVKANSREIFKIRSTGVLLDSPANMNELTRLREHLATKVGTTDPIFATFENHTTDRFATRSGFPRLVTNTLGLAEVAQKVNGIEARREQIQEANRSRRLRYIGGFVITNLLFMAYQHRYELAAFGEDVSNNRQRNQDQRTNTGGTTLRSSDNPSTY